jgi:hypothetical protein
MRTSPLAPGDDVTVHIVLNDFGPLGRAYVETDEAKADEATIIENILSGQYSHLVRVVAFNTVEGWACDVTEDIARACGARRVVNIDQSGNPRRSFWSGHQARMRLRD